MLNPVVGGISHIDITFTVLSNPHWSIELSFLLTNGSQGCAVHAGIAEHQNPVIPLISQINHAIAVGMNLTWRVKLICSTAQTSPLPVVYNCIAADNKLLHPVVAGVRDIDTAAAICTYPLGLIELTVSTA